MGATRTYELKRRAERQDETRRRIVEAAVELHSSLGPARTTVKAVAERAGVTRPTVYAHFPDERALFAACSGHVREAVPAPDGSTWREIEDPERQLTTALTEIYAYFERLEQLFENVDRDAPVMPVVAELRAARVRQLDALRDELANAWGGRSRIRRAIGHAVEFTTWQSLVRRQGCRKREAVELMVALVRAA